MRGGQLSRSEGLRALRLNELCVRTGHRILYLGPEPEVGDGLETINASLGVMKFATPADRTNAVAAGVRGIRTRAGSISVSRSCQCSNTAA